MKNKKYILTFTYFVFFLLLFHFLGNPVSAHVLKTSDSVGAVMHVTPEDDPVAGEQSDFFFEFKDKDNKFNPENCECTVSILQSDKEIFSEPLFANNSNPNLSNASFSFTFPQRDIYKIQIIGKPLASSSFEEFTLEYDLRVERESEINKNAQENRNWFVVYFPYLIGAIIIFVFLFVFVKNKKVEKR